MPDIIIQTLRFDLSDRFSPLLIFWWLACKLSDCCFCLFILLFASNCCFCFIFYILLWLCLWQLRLAAKFVRLTVFCCCLRRPTNVMAIYSSIASKCHKNTMFGRVQFANCHKKSFTFLSFVGHNFFDCKMVSVKGIRNGILINIT